MTGLADSLAGLPWFLLDETLKSWLREDVGRGDQTTLGLGLQGTSEGFWQAKAAGVIAGLPVAARLFYWLDPQVAFVPQVAEGTVVTAGQVVALVQGPTNALLMGERVALNIVMRLSGIATLTRQYVERLQGTGVQVVDTRKTTPGLRLLEKYAIRVGGGLNHRLGLDDAVLVKENHIAVAGGIRRAVEAIRQHTPHPLGLEIEVEHLEQIPEALACEPQRILLDNMTPEQLQQAVQLIRQSHPHIKIEASGNITLENLLAIAATGVDYIATSAPITQARWLDLSMRLKETSPLK
ncbi:MAG: carboxylating nicotinate-nucleotide diphosphorylase [Gloeomargarita sp. SKYBB_i_bin120]|nr:carboxylating nicotinate-nucleotide diphosphorylase [Gloeomargarita sp. SKYG98]MCS7293259.1 carboxylating nicotinate-nucleotide diphosphorylase [Gloeomargarita sp. SKYB120]MDW8178823.1 carboxylating nicotinate-nucleotide diphosphorylase [Gloeomargarita sp. SKYBB_i_bin120]